MLLNTAVASLDMYYWRTQYVCLWSIYKNYLSSLIFFLTIGVAEPNQSKGHYSQTKSDLLTHCKEQEGTLTPLPNKQTNKKTITMGFWGSMVYTWNLNEAAVGQAQRRTVLSGRFQGHLRSHFHGNYKVKIDVEC